MQKLAVAALVGGLLLVVGALWVGSTQLPAIAAGGLLHPVRRNLTAVAPPHCDESTFAGADLTLRGWRCTAPAPVRGTIVYLHGIADNRSSAVGVIARFLSRGFNVVAYDSRAHGASEGTVCTYGFFEKEDLHRIIETLEVRPVILIGTSLGAAVALQEAADDSRVAAIVAAETFSDLRTVARERAPFFLTASTIANAFELAERQGHFRVDDVSPVRSARRIRQPVLLLHGKLDVDTPPAHSQRVFDALQGPKRLMIVPDAHHNESLNSLAWAEIERWVDGSLLKSSTQSLIPHH